MRIQLAAAVLAATLLPALASAHPVPGSLSGSPFRIIDRADSHDALGVDLGVGGLVGDDAEGELISFRLDLHGQLIVGSSVGLTVTLPISALVITGGLDDEEELALGAIDLGAFFFATVGDRGRTTLLARGSLSLPTASDDGLGFLSNLIAAEVSRLTDAILTVPDLLALRTSFSLIHDTRGVVLRFDAGLDTPLASTDSDVDLDHDPLIRINAGIAFGEGPTKLVAELANLANSGDLDEDGEFAHQLAVGVTAAHDRLLYGFSASILVDSLVDDDIDGVIFGLIGSLSTAF
jgi:hypothetical protein